MNKQELSEFFGELGAFLVGARKHVEDAFASPTVTERHTAENEMLLIAMGKAKVCIRGALTKLETAMVTHTDQVLEELGGAGNKKSGHKGKQPEEKGKFESVPEWKGHKPA